MTTRPGARTCQAVALLATLASSAASRPPAAVEAAAPRVVSFGANVMLSGDTTFTHGNDQREASIAASPADPRNVVALFKDRYPGAGDRACRVAFTTDGGLDWVRAGSLPLLPVEPNATNGCTNAAIATDAGGIFYASYLDISFEQLNGVAVERVDLDVAKSTDGGRTFSPRAVAVHGDGVSADPDKPYIAVDAQPGSPFRGTIYVSYTDFAAGIQIRVVVSRDGGTTWSGSLPISRLGRPEAGDFIQYSLPAVAPDGTVYIFWMESDGIFGHLSIKFSRSTNGGKSWSRPSSVASNLPSPGGFRLRTSNSDDTAQRLPLLSNSFPAAGIAANGTIYVAWTDFAEGSCDPTVAFAPLCENADLRLSLSRDAGKHWSAPVKVNDDGARTDQFMPWIATHPDGLLSLVWLDRRLDPDNVNYDVFYSNTLDGATFLPNVRVSSASSLVGTSTQQGLGDYNGLAATADAVFPVWGDLRVQNDMEVFTAVGSLGH